MLLVRSWRAYTLALKDQIVSSIFSLYSNNLCDMRKMTAQGKWDKVRSPQRDFWLRSLHVSEATVKENVPKKSYMLDLPPPQQNASHSHECLGWDFPILKMYGMSSWWWRLNPGWGLNLTYIHIYIYMVWKNPHDTVDGFSQGFFQPSQDLFSTKLMDLYVFSSNWGNFATSSGWKTCLSWTDARNRALRCEFFFSAVFLAPKT